MKRLWRWLSPFWWLDLAFSGGMVTKHADAFEARDRLRHWIHVVYSHKKWFYPIALDLGTVDCLPGPQECRDWLNEILEEWMVQHGDLLGPEKFNGAELNEYIRKETFRWLGPRSNERRRYMEPWP
jgi:hypothetical protein